ncbi:MAG: KH domain-containing protein [Clostridia bacterium]|nr:KH domain-containing protein [Clostridia bacterium]MBQ8505627.1 KH domain-containing protein [Clostridia bacterium]MBQ8873668.1 KH domain-containing protein [Clostridia bacterium]MBQ9706649.1 KH domain-containing protein [Clostridia bacterium]MBR7177236.1 KH domain-containing protein [Clostridia bacterium]
MMLELVKYIVEQLVDDKQAVNITTQVADGVETVSIRVAENDIGKVIGKQGKIAMSIRTLAKAVGMKEGKRYNIEIED